MSVLRSKPGQIGEENKSHPLTLEGAHVSINWSATIITHRLVHQSNEIIHMSEF